MTDIAVVGAGIVGAAIANYAARRGATVTLIDPAPPGSGVTSRSFAWIGESVLPGGVMREWQRLEKTVLGVRVRWTGSLTWGVPGRPDGAEVITSARIAALEPNLRQPPDRAVYRPGDAAVDPVATTKALAAGIPYLQAAVTSVHTGGVETTAGFIAADTIVVAAGTRTPTLCGPLPVNSSPAVLLRYQAPPGLVNTVIAGPDIEIRETGDGELLAAAALETRDLDHIAQQATAAIKTSLRGADTIRLRAIEVGERPMPVDGKPIIGYLREGLYVAVMHSAVTLAPLVGRLVTDEITGSGPLRELSAFRPARFGT